MNFSYKVLGKLPFWIRDILVHQRVKEQPTARSGRSLTQKSYEMLSGRRCLQASVKAHKRKAAYCWNRGSSTSLVEGTEQCRCLEWQRWADKYSCNSGKTTVISFAIQTHCLIATWPSKNKGRAVAMHFTVFKWLPRNWLKGRKQRLLSGLTSRTETQLHLCCGFTSHCLHWDTSRFLLPASPPSADCFVNLLGSHSSDNLDNV